MTQPIAGSIHQPVSFPVIPLREFLPWALFGGLLMLLLTCPALAQSKATQLTKQYGWHVNLDGAKTTARQTGKPIFLVFRCDP